MISAAKVRGATTGRRLAAVLCWLAFFFATALAYAQSDPGSPSSELSESADDPDDTDDHRRMLRLNDEGFEAFEEGDFVEAAEKFEKAHEYVPDPNLRKNAAIAWFHAGNCREATRAASFFLVADEMTVADRIEARSVLGHCRLDDTEEALERGRYRRAQRLVDYVDALETDERVEERLAGVRMAVAEESAGRPGLARADTGWVLVGLGAAIVAGNALYHATSARQRDRLAQFEDEDSHPIRRAQLAENLDTADWLVPT
ncbi:MAG: hypothetical protein ACOCV2_12520, partial [Persicimonas sp.]